LTDFKDKTKLVHAGRKPFENHGVVNPPVYHASTILYQSKEDMDNFKSKATTYGRHGTPGTESFAEAIAALEQADRSLITPSGVAAITVSLLSFLQAGDHLLVADNVYEPTRKFCDLFLSRYGIETTYYDPLIGDSIDTFFTDRTRGVFLESPGSHTFEVQDVPAIVQAVKAAKHKRPILTFMDNTWATPLYFKPLAFGVDVSIQSVTKYIGGHADVMLGTLAFRNELWPQIDRTRRLLGNAAGPDDVYLAQRGLRSLDARLRQHQEHALLVAQWLQRRPEVSRVMYPALSQDPGYHLWKRDFGGATGLFGFILNQGTDKQIAAFLNSLKLFGMGFSWGGYESLLIQSHVEQSRTTTRWAPPGPVFRIHVGLEDPQDLIADLTRGFDTFHSAA